MHPFRSLFTGGCDLPDYQVGLGAVLVIVYHMQLL